jgi:hypothetical protein
VNCRRLEFTPLHFLSQGTPLPSFLLIRRLKVRLATQLDMPRYAIRHVLSLLHPRLTYTLALSQKCELVEAVREMVQTEQGADRSFLHADYVDILANGERYQRELKSRPRLLEMLYGIATGAFRVKSALGCYWRERRRCGRAETLETFLLMPAAADAFVDFHKFQGRDVTPSIPALQAVLPRYAVAPEEVAHFMESPP